MLPVVRASDWTLLAVNDIPRAVVRCCRLRIPAIIGVGVVDGEAADQVDGVLAGADLRWLALERDGQLGDRAAFPAQQQVGAAFGVVAADGDVDLVQQGAQQLLAVLVGGGGRVPDLVQVVAEGQDRVPCSAAVRAAGRCCLAAGQLVPASASCLQRGVPLGFQAAGDQPVLRVDRAVAALGAAGLVAGLLDLAAVLVEDGVVAGLRAGRQRAGRPAARLAGARPGTPRRRRRRSRRRRPAGGGRRGR